MIKLIMELLRIRISKLKSNKSIIQPNILNRGNKIRILKTDGSIAPGGES